jgi:glutathione synthase/RimK-type ligase-like ATP-grasp enzyme
MLTNIKLMLEACQSLGFKYEILHPDGNLVRVIIPKDASQGASYSYYYFTNYSTPLLAQSVAEICKDKHYCHQVWQNVIRMPRTKSFLSPYCDEKYQEYLQFFSTKDIAQDISQNFTYPVIIKRNRGSGGKNVFQCRDLSEVQQAVDTIFDVTSKIYDYVAIAQEPIQIVKEYRCICLQHQPVLVYEKDISQAHFIGNLSPLHWEGAIARQITEAKKIDEIAKFVAPIFTETPSMIYVGLDIAIDDQDRYWLIEANSHPNFDIFVRDNGSRPVVNLFEKILSVLERGIEVL